MFRTIAAGGRIARKTRMTGNGRPEKSPVAEPLDHFSLLREVASCVEIAEIIHPQQGLRATRRRPVYSFCSCSRTSAVWNTTCVRSGWDLSQTARTLMEIHLVSSLTPDDESRLAPSVLAAIGGLLDGLPVSYSVRIETGAGNAIQHSHTAAPASPVDQPDPGPEVSERPVSEESSRLKRASPAKIRALR
jgi:hypothetical protein